MLPNQEMCLRARYHRSRGCRLRRLPVWTIEILG